MSRTYWISIRDLKLHEFKRTLQYIQKSGQSWSEIYLNLGSIQRREATKVTKWSTALAVAYLALSSLSSNGTTSITVGEVTASVSSAFVTLYCSIALFFGSVIVQQLVMVMLARTRLAAIVRLNGFNVGLYGFYNGDDETPLAIPTLLTNYFLGPGMTTSKFLEYAVFFAIFLFLIPPIAFSIYIFDQNLEIVFARSAEIWEKIVATLGCLLVLLSISYIVLFNIPLPFKKNSYGIRWGTLARLYPVGGHARVLLWLEEAKK